MTNKRRVTIITEDDNTPADKKPVTVDITPEDISLAPRNIPITRAGDENAFDFDADGYDDGEEFEDTGVATEDVQELLDNLPRTQETWAIMKHLKTVEMNNLLTAHVIRDIFALDLPEEHIDRLMAVTLLGDVEDLDEAASELEEETLLLFEQLDAVSDQINETDDYTDGVQLWQANQAAAAAPLDVRRVLSCYYIGDIDLMTEMLEADGILPKTEDLRFIGGVIAAMTSDGQLEEVLMASAVESFNRLVQLSQTPLYLMRNDEGTVSLIDSEDNDFIPQGPGPKGPGI